MSEKSDTGKRDGLLLVRVSAEEKCALRGKAAAMGLSLSSWVRMVLLENAKGDAAK